MGTNHRVRKFSELAAERRASRQRLQRDGLCLVNQRMRRTGERFTAALVGYFSEQYALKYADRWERRGKS